MCLYRCSGVYLCSLSGLSAKSCYCISIYLCFLLLYHSCSHVVCHYLSVCPCFMLLHQSMFMLPAITLVYACAPFYSISVSLCSLSFYHFIIMLAIMLTGKNKENNSLKEQRVETQNKAR